MDADNWRDHATLSAREAFAVLGISLAAGYAMMQRGDIPYIKLGPKLQRVSTAWLKRTVDGESRVA